MWHFITYRVNEPLETKLLPHYCLINKLVYKKIISENIFSCILFVFGASRKSMRKVISLVIFTTVTVISYRKKLHLVLDKVNPLPTVPNRNSGSSFGHFDSSGNVVRWVKRRCSPRWSSTCPSPYWWSSVKTTTTGSTTRSASTRTRSTCPESSSAMPESPEAAIVDL